MNAPASALRLTARGLPALCLALASAHALDLTPRHGFREGNEGPPTPVIQFADGNGRVTYRPPADWQPSGGGKSVTFYTADPTSWMKLEVVAAAGSPPLGPTAGPPAEEMSTWAARFLPPGAQKVAFVRMGPSPLTIGAQKGSECIFNFSLSGLHASASISAIDLNDKERLIVLVCALPKNFEHIRQQAISSMFSWAPAG